MTDEPIIKLIPTSAMEAIFRPGNHLSGIWAFLSGFGANKNIMIKLNAFIIQSEDPVEFKKMG